MMWLSSLRMDHKHREIPTALKTKSHGNSCGCPRRDDSGPRGDRKVSPGLLAGLVHPPRREGVPRPQHASPGATGRTTSRRRGGYRARSLSGKPPPAFGLAAGSPLPHTDHSATAPRRRRLCPPSDWARATQAHLAGFPTTAGRRQPGPCEAGDSRRRPHRR